VSDSSSSEARSPLADEAVRLLGAVQEWTRQTFPAGGPDGHGGAECQWCPLCQFMAVLRGERPEVTERVAEAGAALATAVRALVDAAGAGRPPQREEEADRTPRVQRIDLGADPDPE
jgi:hypothetical protein